MASSNDITEDEVKNYIRSILTSTPSVSTIQSVERDYRDLIGSRIPFYKFKYNSIEQFLKSIPDVCKVNGTGNFAQVTPIITEKIAHINKMVTQQKVTTKGRRKPLVPRRTKGTPITWQNFQKPPSWQPAHNYSFSPNSSCNSSLSIGSSDGQSYVHLKQYTSQTNSINYMNNSNCTSSKSQTDVNKTMNYNSDVTNQYIYRTEQQQSGCVKRKEQLDNLIKKQMQIGNITKPTTSMTTQPTHQSTPKSNIKPPNSIPQNAPVLDEEHQHYFIGGEKISNQDTIKNTSAHIEDSQYQKIIAKVTNLPHFESVVEEEDTSNVPKRVQNNLKTLIGQFNDWIWCSDLPVHYRRLFKKDLMFMEYGYTSLIEMCMALKHIFHYVRPGRDDFKLWDQSKTLPESAKLFCTMASYDIGDKKITLGDALPELEWTDFKGTIPTDVFKFGAEIPKEFLPDGTKVEDILDVVVVEMYDPSKFWFYLGKSDRNTPLDKLMDDIQNFYRQPENAKEYAVPSGVVREGLYCVQVIYGEYHRARIVRLLPDTVEHVRVLYIDYGTVCKTPVKGMCFLHTQFAQLPAQAIRCRLANIVPNIKGHPWPRPASDRFRDLINGRDTKIKISYINWDEEYVCVFLADVTDMDNVLYINDVLVKEHHALWDGETQISPLLLPNFKCKVQNLHLFPTFLELELGLAPNASEMYSLEEMLVPVQFCIPQYFEPNDQLFINEDEVESSEKSFIETVKNHRKFTPFYNIDFDQVVNAPPIDFSLFGDLKEDIQEFYATFNLGDENKCELNCKTGEEEELSCDYECEASGERTNLTREDYEPVRRLKEDKELSENIMKKLDKYGILDEEKQSDCGSTLIKNDVSSTGESLDLDLNEEIENELSTIFELSEPELEVDAKKNCIFGLAQGSNDETNIFDDPEAFQDKSSEGSSKVVSPESFLRNVARLCQQEVEEESDSCENTVTENSSIKNGDPENTFSYGTDNLDRLLAPDVDFESFIKMRKANLNNNHANVDNKSDKIDRNSLSGKDDDDLVKTEGIDEESFLKFSTRRDRVELFTDNIRRKKEMECTREAERRFKGCESDMDLPAKSKLEKTKIDFVSTLSLTNPFRVYLEKQLENEIDNLSTISSEDNRSEEKITRTSCSSPTTIETLGSETTCSSINFLDNQSLLTNLKISNPTTATSHTSDTDRSDYRSFTPKIPPFQSNTLPKVHSSRTAGVCSPTSSAPPSVFTSTKVFTPPVGTPPRAFTPPVSTPPRVYTPPVCNPQRGFAPPTGYMPMGYPQWSNGGGFPVQQYTQWSNGGNYPNANYPNFNYPNANYPTVNQPHGYQGGNLRPPPGFPQAPPSYNPNYYPNYPNYNARMSYPQANVSMPPYYGPLRPMMPPLGNMSIAQKDFYDRYNEELLRNMKPS